MEMLRHTFLEGIFSHFADKSEKKNYVADMSTWEREERCNVTQEKSHQRDACKLIKIPFWKHEPTKILSANIVLIIMIWSMNAGSAHDWKPQEPEQAALFW